MDNALDALKRDEAALWQAYADLGGKRNPQDSKHNSCPFCNDETGFMIGSGGNGVVGWRCYAQKGGACAHDGSHPFTGSIVDLLARAKGITNKDACKLALERYGRGVRSAAGSTQIAPAASPASAPATPRKEGKRYPTGLEAIDALTHALKRQGGKLGPVWQYHSADGEPVIQVARFNLPGGKKEFRPLHRDGQGWRIGLGSWGKGAPCPLYQLPKVLAAAGDVIHVAEGEKCADGLRELGYVATTSQGGSGRARETDWAPAAAAARVVLWMDIDAPGKDGANPGEKYVGDVAGLIADAAARAGGACPEIVIVDLGKPVQSVDAGAVVEMAAVLAPGQDVFDAIANMNADGKSAEEIRTWLDACVGRYGRSWARRIRIEYPGQPAPYPGLAGGKRPEICNYAVTTRDVVDDKGETRQKKISLMVPIESLRERIQKISGGWLVRLKSQGSRSPLLFIDEEGRPEVRFVQTSEQFESWMHEIGTPKFNPKQDTAGANYVRPALLFNSFGAAKDIREFEAVQARPHEPLIPSHYYTWRAPANYAPDGRRLAELLGFFTNAKDAVSRAVIAAAIMTPGWGGAYGKRPMITITAPDRGCGKSTLAWAISKIWGGSLSVDFSQRGEDQLLGRLLSPDALLKVCCIVDNLKGGLSNAKLEALITDELISGHALYRGDATRPNVLTWFLTSNGVRLSRDLAQRSYFVELIKPRYCANWDKRLSEFITVHMDEIVADVVYVLRTASKCALALNDRWSRWAEEVLYAACTHPALAGVVGADAKAVLEATHAMREECDQDRDEMKMFVAGLLERVCGSPGERYASASLIYYTMSEPLLEGVKAYPRPSGGLLVTRDAAADWFIRSDEMMTHWYSIFGKKLNAKQIKHVLRDAREAGRIASVIAEETGLQDARLGRIDEKHTAAGNGFVVSQEAMQAYVEKVRKEAIESVPAVAVG